MTEDEWFEVPDLTEFTNKVRAIVYNNFGEWNDKSDEVILTKVKENEIKDLDTILSHQESLLIIKENIKKERNKRTKKIRFILNDIIFADIISKLNDRMVSNLLNNLVKKGLVDSAFDDEKNDFIFWIKEDDKTEKEKPETD
jgi:hypothetical protein